MKKLFLLLGLLLIIGCSPEETGCDCEATMTYEFSRTSMASPDAYTDYPKNPQTGNYIMTMTEEAPCGTTEENIDKYEVFGMYQDLAIRQVSDEEITVKCD